MEQYSERSLKLIRSMPKRVEKVIKQKGYSINY